MMEKAANEMNNESKEFLAAAIECKCLRFGDFTLKSGLKSPYFFNAGNFSTGRSLHRYANAYASYIASAMTTGIFGRVDVLFGPAYKGIPLVAAISTLLWSNHGIDIPFVYDRKEPKDHGEGGVLVGVNELLKDRTKQNNDIRVLVVDDVITAGTAIKMALKTMASESCDDAKFSVAGVLVSFDRQERVPGSDLTNSQRVENELGIPVKAVTNFNTLCCYLDANGQKDQAKALCDYMETK